ncbi:hypothetical protein Pan153_53430 [Gimesia panareensis]|uniref:Uncharacterized protein n=1 Tax=Gimesia panareensis TaxID=2527978 RepID=A0A518FWC3_9PLAN|nr:DUF4031 domain-containing protein [Gimesia panareensis]QDV20667.1 hypothetical protein Pan153_53430 [Gimesia panareensis]
MAAAVYVDQYDGGSHLFVDPETSLDVLHEFAMQINLPGSAYKVKGIAIPHYLLNQKQRDQAIAEGAMCLDETGVESMEKSWTLPMIGIHSTVSVQPGKQITNYVRRTFGHRDPQPGALMKAAVRIQGDLGVTTRVIRVVSVRREALSKMEHDPDYGRWEAELEGWPQLSGAEFVRCFCKKFKVVPATPVTRIEFTYV